MITKIWRSDDGLTLVWEVNPGMLFSYDVITQFYGTPGEGFRHDCLENPYGGYTLVWEGA